VKQTFHHRPNLLVQADFATEQGQKYRYRLEITKEGTCSHPRTVCAVMQNPSYAGVDIADKSVQVLERVVFEHGLPQFNGVERLIVINQFAFIQTKDFVGADTQVGSRNNEAIASAMQESEIILIAWGKSNRFSGRQRVVMEMLSELPGKSVLQTSRHPSRVTYDGFIQPLVIYS
jgi:hypothetical protein